MFGKINYVKITQRIFNIIKMTDREILNIYIKGFNEELNLEYNNPYKKGSVEFHAYDLGSLHAIVGDDCSSVDYLSDEEILNIIKGKL